MYLEIEPFKKISVQLNYKNFVAYIYNDLLKITKSN